MALQTHLTTRATHMRALSVTYVQQPTLESSLSEEVARCLISMSASLKRSSGICHGAAALNPTGERLDITPALA